MDKNKMEGEELTQYWNTLLDRRMPEDDEVNRLISVLKGHYLSHLMHGEISPPKNTEELLWGLIEYHGEKRPYGNKDVAASIAYQLGWDYKRQLCYHALPETVEAEAEKLHNAVLAELKESGWIYT